MEDKNVSDCDFKIVVFKLILKVDVINEYKIIKTKCFFSMNNACNNACSTVCGVFNCTINIVWLKRLNVTLRQLCVFYTTIELLKCDSYQKSKIRVLLEGKHVDLLSLCILELYNLPRLAGSGFSQTSGYKENLS